MPTTAKHARTIKILTIVYLALCAVTAPVVSGYATSYLYQVWEVTVSNGFRLTILSLSMLSSILAIYGCLLCSKKKKPPFALLIASGVMKLASLLAIPIACLFIEALPILPVLVLALLVIPYTLLLCIFLPQLLSSALLNADAPAKEPAPAPTPSRQSVPGVRPAPRSAPIPGPAAPQPSPWPSFGPQPAYRPQPVEPPQPVPASMFPEPLQWPEPVPSPAPNDHSKSK